MARPQKFRLSPDDVLDPQNARKLAGHVAEIEFFRAEVEKLQAQIAGIYDAADEEGFDKKFIRKVVAIRAKDEAEAKAEEHGIEAYTAALEIGFRSRARVGNETHDADTGEIIENEIPGSHIPAQSTGENPVTPSLVVEVDETANDLGGETEPPNHGSAPVTKPDLTKAAPWCQDPEDCGGASWTHPCGSCLRRRAQSEAGRALQ